LRIGGQRVEQRDHREEVAPLQRDLLEAVGQLAFKIHDKDRQHKAGNDAKRAPDRKRGLMPEARRQKQHPQVKELVDRDDMPRVVRLMPQDAVRLCEHVLEPEAGQVFQRIRVALPDAFRNGQLLRQPQFLQAVVIRAERALRRLEHIFTVGKHLAENKQVVSIQRQVAQHQQQSRSQQHNPSSVPFW